MTNWEDKVKAFLHDPPSKALRIPGHKTMSGKMLDVWYAPSGGDEKYDQIAASADRPGVPGHGDGCSVDFIEAPELTHPISKGRLNIKLKSLNIDDIQQKVVSILDDIDLNKDIPYESKFYNIFEGLKQRLSIQEPDLCSIWSKIPADTRIPDHSIWHHNAMVSALATCKNEPYFFVFSLGPVQGFISEARKLRDLWVGSMVLSYLAWAGIRVICDTFGPDHIVYPSLSGQPFFFEHIQDKKLSEIFEDITSEQQRIASFPNKFVAILPKDAVKETGRQIEEAIINEWKAISDSVYSRVYLRAASNPEYFKEIWDRQNSNLWEFYWLASPWLKTIEDNLAKEISEDEKGKIDKLSKLFKESSGYNANQGICYSPSHGLAQGLHAALKNSRSFHENYSEPGDKCTQCGKRQQLSITDDREGTREFWKNLKTGIGDDIKENERLCSICLIKRIAGRGSRGLPSQLEKTLTNNSFPSSTEMAFSHIIRQLSNNGKEGIWKDFVQECEGEEKAYDTLHDNDEDRSNGKANKFFRRLRDEAGVKSTNIFGKYYAILLMDGDKMGDLVNGKADNLAKWQDIMHSSLPEKLKNSSSKAKAKGWLEGNTLQEKRHLTPSVHKAISEALGDFALNTVPYVVKKHYGRLIYAGGDDVLAVMPVDTVLKAAQEIMDLYRTPFLVKRTDGAIDKCGGEYTPVKGEKLLIHLGEAATISAAVVIAHHKAPLRGLLEETHQVLAKEAKEQAGRDAVAILLKKRGGAEKLIAQKWKNSRDENYIELLMKLVDNLCGYDEKASSKLMYKIEQNRVALETLVKKGLGGSVEKLLESLIEKGQRDKDKNESQWKQAREEQAKRLKTILFGDSSKLNTDGLMIARFLAQATGGGEQQ
ncbi:MAG: type III-B CRISPR-associated protein Cas10/Cmr2 [Syntrophus sp. (in: bacteria)]|nr:type III-B CRISPR-associated protein Cas10/Cmr2 [Syntrophus sp. (in: bacteria)]